MKKHILTDKQFNSPENQNRDKAIIGYISIETKTNDKNLVCEHNYKPKKPTKNIKYCVCTKCGEFNLQTIH